MKSICLAALVAASSPAWADCPVSADLAQGIRFAVAEGDTETFRSLRPGVVEATYQDIEGMTFRNLLGQGIYLLEWLDIVDGQADLSTRSVYAFAMGPKDMPIPEPGGSANLNVLVNSGGSLEQEMQMYSFGAETRLTFDTCDYRMIPIEIRYAPAQDRGVDLLHYLPELGLAYFAQNTVGDEVDSYNYHKIEVVK